MKFFVENISKKSGRLGYLLQRQNGKKFQTPLLVQVTKGGSIPYLARDVFDRVINETQLLQMSLATMDHMSEGIANFQANREGGLATYVGFKGYPTILIIRDPCEEMPNGFHEKDVTPLFTRRGKQCLSAKKYMDFVEIFKPDLYQGLNDANTNWESAKKRLQKSQERTEKFMDYCYERHQQQTENLQNSCLLAPIVGGFCKYTRSLSIKHSTTKTVNVGGYIFEGFHNYGLTATEVTSDQMLPIMKHCLDELNEAKAIESKPIMLTGAYTPLVMLQLIQLGVDMFDTSYAYIAAINFKALAYEFDLNKEGKGDEAAVFIDITDTGYKEDFTPLIHDCRCLACQKHTKAYIHHLYYTSELLGPILLMIHNLHHMLQFFFTIQTIISQDRLDELIQLIKYQRSVKEVNYSIKKNTKVIEKIGIGKGLIKTDATT